ncbi:hypothetical protein H9P43_005667 [Blastocladiella emersonii ATCC 22665]|nr:hypothetical protein H9P43_005667 [Blastocladiella emersonii ATCC 22665]
MSHQSLLVPGAGDPGGGGEKRRSRKSSFTQFFSGGGSGSPTSRDAPSPPAIHPPAHHEKTPGSFTLSPITISSALTSMGGSGGTESIAATSMPMLAHPSETEDKSPRPRFATAAANSAKGEKKHLSLFGGVKKKKLMGTSSGGMSPPPSTASGAGAADEKRKKMIGTPFNFERKVHVDGQLNWFGDSEDPADLFTLEEKLGEGAFGCVYRGILKQTGFVLAVKEITLHEVRGRPGATEQLAMIEKEISVLKKCVHRNTVQYYGCCRRAANRIWILTDFCGGGSMSDILALLAAQPPVDSPASPSNASPGGFPSTVVLQRQQLAGARAAFRACPSGLTESEVAAVAGGALEGLAFLHGKGIIHRDLKAANILLTSTGEVKIADFGVSEQLTTTAKNRNTVVGTPLWMSPEVIQGADYSLAADVWSFGITVIEATDGAPPHFDEHPMRVLFKIPHLPEPTVAHPEACSPVLVDFIARCLRKIPADRATATELLAHAFVAPFVGQHGAAARSVVLGTRAPQWAAALRAARTATAAVGAPSPHDDIAAEFNAQGAAGGDADGSWEAVGERSTADEEQNDDAAGGMVESQTVIFHGQDDDEAVPAESPAAAADAVVDASATVVVYPTVIEIQAAKAATLPRAFSKEASPPPQPAASAPAPVADPTLVPEPVPQAEVVTATDSPSPPPRPPSWAARIHPVLSQLHERVERVCAPLIQQYVVPLRAALGPTLQHAPSGVGVHVLYVSVILGMHFYYSHQLQAVRLQVAPSVS